MATWYKKRKIKTILKEISTIAHCTGSVLNLFSPFDFFRFLKKISFLPFDIYKDYRFLKKTPHDFIHLNSSVLISMGIAAYLSSSSKLLWHIREMLHPGRLGIRRKLIEQIIDFCSHKIICISPVEASFFSKQDKTEIIYDFIDDEMMSEISISKEKSGRNEEKMVFLTLGGLNLIKGADLLLEAALKQENVSSFKIIIVGDLGLLGDSSKKSLLNRDKFAYMERVKRLLQECKGNDIDVALHGSTSDVGSFLKECDVLYFGGTGPHFPRPILESWCYGKKVLAFDIPGINDLVAHKIDGELTRENAADLAISMDKFVKDRSYGDNFSSWGRKKVLARFDKKKNVDLFMQILGE